MSLPKAVQEAAARSEALAKQLREGKPQAEEAGTTSPEQKPDETPDGDNRDTLPTQAQQKPPQDPQPPQPKEDEETYKQRYFTLKGKFDSEIPRLRHENQRLNTVVQDLQNQIVQLQDQPAANSKQPGDDPEPGLNADAFEEYGPEFEALARTVQALQQENSRLRGRIENLSGDFQQTQEQTAATARQNYMGQVVSHVAKAGVDFQNLNTDSQFLNWLRQFPDGEFESRHDKLRRAEANMDLEATKGIFDEYLGKPQAPEQPKQPMPNIQPSTSTPGTDVNPPNPAVNERQWTRADISKFYEDKIRGVYNGREEEARAIEMDIHSAAGEGRIRG